MATVVVDPGHGGFDPGAVSGTRKESEDNLRLGLAVRDALQKYEINVIMTRTSDVYVPLTERSYISNSNNADAFISLHRNASLNSAANGVETFTRIGASAFEQLLATNVLNNVVNVGVQSNRGVKQENFAVLRNTYAPAQLFETGFITNAADNQLFDANLYAYADAIARGIATSLGISTTPGGGTQTIRNIQSTLNQRYGTGLAVDGVWGPQSQKGLLKGLQIELNNTYGAGLAVDGVWGPKTKAAVRSIKNGARGNIVWLLQSALVTRGYNIAVDGAFGNNTEAAVRQFQQANGLTVDGIAGPNTFEALFK